jgi:hypothetical protein
MTWISFVKWHDTVEVQLNADVYNYSGVFIPIWLLQLFNQGWLGWCEVVKGALLWMALHLIKIAM